MNFNWRPCWHMLEYPLSIRNTQPNAAMRARLFAKLSRLVFDVLSADICRDGMKKISSMQIKACIIMGAHLFVWIEEFITPFVLNRKITSWG